MSGCCPGRPQDPSPRLLQWAAAGGGLSLQLDLDAQPGLAPWAWRCPSARVWASLTPVQQGPAQPLRLPGTARAHPPPPGCSPRWPAGFSSSPAPSARLDGPLRSGSVLSAAPVPAAGEVTAVGPSVRRARHAPRSSRFSRASSSRRPVPEGGQLVVPTWPSSWRCFLSSSPVGGSSLSRRRRRVALGSSVTFPSPLMSLSTHSCGRGRLLLAPASDAGPVHRAQGVCALRPSWAWSNGPLCPGLPRGCWRSRREPRRSLRGCAVSFSGCPCARQTPPSPRPGPGPPAAPDQVEQDTETRARAPGACTERGVRQSEKLQWAPRLTLFGRRARGRDSGQAVPGPCKRQDRGLSPRLWHRGAQQTPTAGGGVSSGEKGWDEEGPSLTKAWPRPRAAPPRAVWG